MIAELCYFHLVYSSFIFDHGWLHSNLFLNMSKLFLSKLAFFTLHDGISGTFHNCTNSKLGRKQFCQAIQNDRWAAIPEPVWMTSVPYERKINMQSSTDNNFILSFWFWEIKDWISVYIFETHTVFLPTCLHPVLWSHPHPETFVLEKDVHTHPGKKLHRGFERFHPRNAKKSPWKLP